MENKKWQQKRREKKKQKRIRIKRSEKKGRMFFEVYGKGGPVKRKNQ